MFTLTIQLAPEDRTLFTRALDIWEGRQVVQAQKVIDTQTKILKDSNAGLRAALSNAQKGE